MKITVLIRKAIFLLSGRVILSDSVRNTVYQWAWEHIRSLNIGASVCDIGSRTSAFPAFLAWRGMAVSAVEPDIRFTGSLLSIARKWQVSYEIIPSNFLKLAPDRKFDCITALFSLQHAGNSDTAAYLHGASLISKDGLFLIVNEYTNGDTQWQRGRDDGDLRIYGKNDLQERLEKPLQNNGFTIIEKKAALFIGSQNRRLQITDIWENAQVALLVARKSQ